MRIIIIQCIDNCYQLSLIVRIIIIQCIDNRYQLDVDSLNVKQFECDSLRVKQFECGIIGRKNSFKLKVKIMFKKFKKQSYFQMYVYVGTVCHNMNYVIQWGILSEQTDVRFLREVRNTSIYTVHPSLNYPQTNPSFSPNSPYFRHL